jgi:hypothetical protein
MHIAARQLPCERVDARGHMSWPKGGFATATLGTITVSSGARCKHQRQPLPQQERPLVHAPSGRERDDQVCHGVAGIGSKAIPVNEVIA